MCRGLEGCRRCGFGQAFERRTPDKLPLIGPSAEDEKILLATGHEGLGITTSMGDGSFDYGSCDWAGDGDCCGALSAYAGKLRGAAWMIRWW
ncbi:MAG: hypothetical protein WDN23_06630 [Edaphobacter sp.]